MSTFASSHFQLHELAEGVFAAIHREGGGAQSNAGIVDLGDRVLVFDAFISPAAAADLRDAAAALFPHRASALINSHYHNDHTWGNQAFAGDIPIISTAKTRELIATVGAEENRSFAANSEERLETAIARLQQEEDETARRLLSYSVTYYRTILEALAVLEVRLPNLTFLDRMDFHGPRREAQLICFGGGHTGSDSILYLPEERIIFMADLLFIDTHPYLGDGDPDELRRNLSRVMQLPADTLVPGHGHIGKPGDIENMLHYLDRLEGMVEEGMRQGLTEEDVTRQPMPEEYRGWIFQGFFPTNLGFLHDLRLKGSAKKRGR